MIHSMYSTDITMTDLLKTIDKNTSRKLRRDVQRSLDDVPEELLHLFPFSVKNYRKLTELQSIQVKIALIELQAAIDEYRETREHLYETARECVNDVVGEDVPMTRKQVDEKIIDNDKYVSFIKSTLLATIISNHLRQSERTMTILRDCVIRNETVEQTVSQTVAYVSRTSKSNSDRVLFTNGTRVVHDADKMGVQMTQPDDDMLLFYSVAVKDDKTCADCKRICNAQYLHPIPYDDLVGGLNAPPFHPYCRCHTELITLQELREREQWYR